jgi:hypothetical protein
MDLDALHNTDEADCKAKQMATTSRADRIKGSHEDDSDSPHADALQQVGVSSR